MAVPPPDVLAAYFDSVYQVDCPRGTVSFRIGDRLPRALHRPFALVTAWNPRSRRLDRGRNARRQQCLLRELASRPGRVLPARGYGEDGWHEESVAVFDIMLPAALRLARKYGQYAFVWGDGRCAALIAGDGKALERPS